MRQGLLHERRKKKNSTFTLANVAAVVGAAVLVVVVVGHDTGYFHFDDPDLFPAECGTCPKVKKREEEEKKTILIRTTCLFPNYDLIARFPQTLLSPSQLGSAGPSAGRQVLHHPAEEDRRRFRCGGGRSPVAGLSRVIPIRRCKKREAERRNCKLFPPTGTKIRIPTIPQSGNAEEPS